MRRPGHGARAGQGRGARHPRRDGRRAAGRSGHRDRHQPDHPGRPRRGEPGGARRGQARLHREAARHAAGGRRGHPGAGAGKGAARRLRARHLPGRRPADLPQADRRRRDRRAGRGDGVHDRPRPRGLASRPGVLLQARRRADVRHGTVLPDRAGQPARPDRPRHRLGAHHLPGAHDQQRPEARPEDRRRDADARRRRAGLRRRRGGTIITSFDVWAANLPRIEIYGTEGSLSVPDPNTFGGPVRIRPARTRSGATCR